MTLPIEPQSYEETINDPIYGKEWELAIKEEYDSLMKNGAWELVENPPSKNNVSCKWILKAKQDANGNIVRFKARVVALSPGGFPGSFFCSHIGVFIACNVHMSWYPNNGYCNIWNMNSKGIYAVQYSMYNVLARLAWRVLCRCDLRGDRLKLPFILLLGWTGSNDDVTGSGCT